MMAPRHQPLCHRVFKLEGILGKLVAVVLMPLLAVVDSLYLILFLLEQLLPLEEE